MSAEIENNRIETLELYSSTYGRPFDLPSDVQQCRLNSLLLSEYQQLTHDDRTTTTDMHIDTATDTATDTAADIDAVESAVSALKSSTALSVVPASATASGAASAAGGTKGGSLAVALHAKMEAEKPEWHAPWKLMRVIAGHNGWVRSIAVDASNEWFATGSADRTIKVWDMASGRLKLTLTGHINTVRGLAISDTSPYMFSVGDDKMVRCWDLEVNKVIRHYHGHTSGVYSCALHPTLGVLFSGARDSSVRVWDVRTKTAVHVLSGHRDTVWSVAAQSAEPQVISGSADCCVRTWDLAAGKCMAQLTHHKKQVRAVIVHPDEYTFATAGADNLKKWACPEARFMLNFSGHNAIVNSLACNGKVLVSSADNGSMRFWDWRTGYCFQQGATIVQPGSLESEAGIFASTFDKTGSRLITCEADKSIKVYKEDDTASEQTHPIETNWRAKVKQNSFF